MKLSPADKAVEKQAKVLRLKAEAARCAVPGQPTPYVDAKGGLMRPLQPQPAAKPSSSSSGLLPLRPRLLLGSDVQWRDLNKAAQEKYIRKNGLDDPDVLVVRDTLASWDSADGLLARLAGVRFADLAWVNAAGGRHFHFECGLEKARLILYLSEPFVKQFPKHAEVLRSYSLRSKSYKLHGKILRNLELRDDPFPAQPQFPDRTYLVQGTEEQGAKHGIRLTKLLSKLTWLLA